MTERRSNKGSPVNFLLVLSLPDAMLGNFVIALPSSRLGCSRWHCWRGGGFFWHSKLQTIDAHKWCTLHPKTNNEETTWYLFCDWRNLFFLLQLGSFSSCFSFFRSSFYMVFTTKTRQNKTTYIMLLWLQGATLGIQFCGFLQGQTSV